MNFIDHPTILMDDVRASLPPLKTVVPLSSAKATLKHSLNTGLVGANLGESKVDSETNLSDTGIQISLLVG